MIVNVILNVVFTMKTKTDTFANSVEPDDQSRLIRIYTGFHTFFLLVAPFAKEDMSKFEAGRVQFRNLGLTGLNMNFVCVGV